MNLSEGDTFRDLFRISQGTWGRPNFTIGDLSACVQVHLRGSGLSNREYGLLGVCSDRSQWVLLPRLHWVILIRYLCRVAAGEHSRTTIKTPNGLKNVPNYALIQGIFVGCVATFIVILAILGSENHGSYFEREAKQRFKWAPRRERSTFSRGRKPGEYKAWRCRAQ